ncbi:amidohydrolase [Leptotrichia sp. OH3620_COT-345]|uniref:amidohydrolase n=1 Tax=Leptotrichia sp. OH3620_COT-345 TaxID=2491048 RepID=UPI001F259516|nr:amidohydrolase [Leptotrichia sp. OH3620_COT-345]
MKKMFILLILSLVMGITVFGENVDILIKNATILTMNEKKEVIENGVIVIKNSKIKAIGNEKLLSKYKGKKVIDAAKDIVMPGFINTHTHVSMVPFRSLADDVPDRLRRYIFPLENKLVSRELVYKGAIYGILEMISTGTTTFADMYYFEDEVAKAAELIGMRGVLGETVIKNPVADAKEPYGGIEYAEKFIKQYKNSQLVTPAFAPHAPYTVEEEYLKKVTELSKKYNVPVLMHIAETENEVKQIKEKYNKTVIEYLDSIGFLTDKVVAGHVIFVNDSDIKILKERNVGIAHNMVANIKSAKGVSPALKMFDEGLRVGLGTDGPMSGNTLDLVSQLGYVAKVHKLNSKNRAAMPPYKVVEMATIGGAKALHMEDVIGSLEEGKLADIIIIDTKSLNMQPIYDYYSAIVYSMLPGDVKTTIINGKIIMENKKIKTYDVEKAKKDLKTLENTVKKEAEKL